MTEEYDVVVVGFGPAGGQTARNLSKRGYKVLLVDRLKDYQENNFSSAGMTLEPLKEFNLPEKIIGAYWKDITIECTEKGYDWFGDVNKGVVLDFGKLRQFLAEETIANGGEVLLGNKYLGKEIKDNKVTVSLLNSETSKEVKVKAKILVDATGPLRKVIYDDKEEQPKMMLGSGTEYLIEIDQETYDKFKERLVFFLGYKWTIKGYSWIFPMENKILKVGSGKNHIKSKDQDYTDKTTKRLTEKIIKEYIKPNSYKLLDVHGGILRYKPGLKDIYYRNKVVGVGDTISAINPRGGEGIRYAMQSAELASIYIDEYLKTGKENFKNYKKEWRKEKLVKWRLSEMSGRRMYSRYTDKQVENRVAFFHKNFSIDDLIATLFNFKYNKLMSRFFHLFLLKIKFFIKREKF